MSATLTRLEIAEAEAFRVFQDAVASGDIGATKASREGWLRLSESLRKYDLAVSEARRHIEEQVPRSLVERCLRATFCWLGISIQRAGARFCTELAGADAPTIRATLQNELHSAVIGGLACFREITFSGAKVPEWIFAAALTDLENRYRGVEGLVRERAALLAELLAEPRKEAPPAAAETPAASPQQAAICAATVNSAPTGREE